MTVCWNAFCIASFCDGVGHVDASGHSWNQRRDGEPVFPVGPREQEAKRSAEEYVLSFADDPHRAINAAQYALWFLGKYRSAPDLETSHPLAYREWRRIVGMGG